MQPGKKELFTSHHLDMSTEVKRIPIAGSQAYWEQNANYPNNYTIEKRYYKMGKSWLHDKSGIHIYGWIEEVMYGEDKGKFKAGHPAIYDEETDSDAVCLGLFDTVEDAMKAILESNHPDYGIYI